MENDVEQPTVSAAAAAAAAAAEQRDEPQEVEPPTGEESRAAEESRGVEETQEEEEEEVETQLPTQDQLFFPEHEKYKRKLIKSQKLANENNKRTQICWRGYRTAVKPGSIDLEQNDDVLDDMLMTALKNMKNISPDEEKVKINLRSLSTMPRN